MKRLPVILAFVMVLSSGLVQAWWKDNARKSRNLAEAVARVQLVPWEIGPWKGKPLEMDAKEFTQAGAEGFWMRQYVHRSKSVTVLLMCGRAGRMAVHTPEFCYQGLGYQTVAAPVRQDIPSRPGREGDQFWTARFTKQFGMAGDLRLFWGWNAGAGWQAPSSPRWEYRGVSFLYKLYLVNDTNAGQRVENEAGFAFLKQLLPELEKTLFPGPRLETRQSEVIP